MSQKNELQIHLVWLLSLHICFALLHEKPAIFNTSFSQLSLRGGCSLELQHSSLPVPIPAFAAGYKVHVYGLETLTCRKHRALPNPF